MSEDSDAEDIAEDDDDVFAVHDEPFVVQPCVAEEVPFFGRLDDFEHLTQFMGTGNCVCSPAELHLVKFVWMAVVDMGRRGSSRKTC